jgi:D-ribose pyranase
MKKSGHLNREISRVLASMGHTDSIVIADCGLPIPRGVECIDLSLALGDPAFLRVLETVLSDLKVERAVFAGESREHNSTLLGRAFSTLLGRASEMTGEAVRVEFVAHEKLKELTRDARAIIRTGEATPFANVILYSDVIFGSGSEVADSCKSR